MLHNGAAPDQAPTAETPVCAHVSVMLEDRKNVASHANVAVEPWLFVAVSVGPLPLVGADMVGHVAIAHVGSAPLHAPEEVDPVCVHVRGDEEERAYPVLHAYVATEPCMFAFVVVGTWPLPTALLSVGHVARAHVGALPLHAPTDAPAELCEHVRVAVLDGA